MTGPADRTLADCLKKAVCHVQHAKSKICELCFSPEIDELAVIGFVGVFMFQYQAAEFAECEQAWNVVPVMYCLCAGRGCSRRQPTIKD